MNVDARRTLTQYATARGATTSAAISARRDDWDDARETSSSEFRPMGDQLAELGRRFGVRKRAIASELRMQASTFSMQIRRGLTIEQIEQIARVVGVHPGYFDEYVVQRIAQMARENTQILRIARLRACAVDPAQADSADADIMRRLWEAVPGGQPTRTVPKKTLERAARTAS
jgi:hypothetical protein